MLLSGKLKPATVTLPLLPGVLVLPVVPPQAAAAMANATSPACNQREPSLRFIEAPPWPGRDFRSNPAPAQILPSPCSGRLERRGLSRHRRFPHPDPPRHQPTLQERERAVGQQSKRPHQDGAGKQLDVILLREPVDDVAPETPAGDGGGERRRGHHLDGGGPDPGH